MLHQTPFQIINLYSISIQNRASELLWQRLLKGWCESDVNSAEFYRSVNTMGVTSGAGTAYPLRAPDFTPGFLWGSCYSIFSFMCNVL
jgi:hypothetical protein